MTIKKLEEESKIRLARLQLKMRDLVFKNLTSTDHKRKIVASSEVVERHGVRSIIQRHFVCLIKEINHSEMQKTMQYLYVLKKRDNKTQEEKFFCRIKGSLYTTNKDKLFLVVFTHSLKISLMPTIQGLMGVK